MSANNRTIDYRVVKFGIRLYFMGPYITALHYQRIVRVRLHYVKTCETLRKYTAPLAVEFRLIMTFL